MSFLIDKLNLELEFYSSIELNSQDHQPTSLSFQHAIKIYINKPQVVNKWVAGSILLSNTDSIPNYNNKIKDLVKNIETLNFNYELREFLSKTNKIFQNLKYLIINDTNFANILFYPILIESSNQDIKYSSVTIIHLFQFDDKSNKINLFIDKNNTFKLDDDKFKLQTNWLKINLLPKLKTWCENVKIDDEFSCSKLNTLTLYPNMIDDYVKLYQHLKSIYYNRFEPIWFELTNTDPEKYIHEDISIASYFILVWKYFKFDVKNFVDLGCGNGLLVYILNDQGFAGYGIDMRKRRIWSNEFYVKCGLKLVEKTIDPRSDTYEGCDWLLANHSDELTPWLPVLALKTSIKTNSFCNFLLIPCCLFDFNSKYEVKKKNESRYDTYLNYIISICENYRFKLYKDKLRIPSTKNVCLICLQTELMDQNLSKINNEKLIKIFRNENIEFKARDLDAEKLKSSRNCTKNVDYDLKVFIVRQVLDNLLNDKNGKLVYIEKENGKWNSGCVMSLADIARLFDQDILNKLKLECGGIKV